MSNMKTVRISHRPESGVGEADGEGRRPGELAHLLHEIRAAMLAAIKACPLSRHQIAGEMSHLLDRDLSKDVLDKYCAESADSYRPPADALIAFCLVTQSMRPLELLAQAARHVAVPLPNGEGEGCLRSAVLRIGAELGDVCRLTDVALADGQVSLIEAAQLRRELDDVIRKAAQMSDQLARRA